MENTTPVTHIKLIMTLVLHSHVSYTSLCPTQPCVGEVELQCIQAQEATMGAKIIQAAVLARHLSLGAAVLHVQDFRNYQKSKKVFDK